jgi:hypothetical protein
MLIKPALVLALAAAAVLSVPSGGGTSVPRVDGAGPGGRLTDAQKQTMLNYLDKHLACMRQHGFDLPDPVVGPDSVSVDLSGIPGTEPFDANSRWFRTSQSCDADLGLQLPR